ncbi:hypothetical protein D9M69_666040 [compost metagenome]
MDRVTRLQVPTRRAHEDVDGLVAAVGIERDEPARHIGGHAVGDAAEDQQRARLERFLLEVGIARLGRGRGRGVVVGFH